MKKSRRSPGRPRTPVRRWHIPPPLIHGSDPLEGGAILRELPDAVGVVLWQAFRDVTLWATSDPKRRAAAFSPVAAAGRAAAIEHLSATLSEPEALISPLRTLHQLVDPELASREADVAAACRQISDWAYERGKLGTALAFAQDAALASSADASAAFWVATLAVRLSDHARAEVWFRRAVGLARQKRDWRMYSRSFSGLGNLYIRRGNLPAARRLHTRALRGARRGGMRREQATALHDLFAVAVEMGNATEADRFAALALQAYGARNRRVHILAHDVAYFWMEQGRFDRALPVFQAVLPLIERPLERVFVLADIARAAGGVGKADIARTAASQVWASTRDPETERGASSALLEVARGLLSLGLLDEADAAARQALSSSVTHREAKTRFAAEALLDVIDRRELSPSPHPGVPAVSGSPNDLLAAEFVRTLEEVAGAPR
jgi:tetratricopeptide (TPR) repeat protein